jgi:transcriptional regulator with XRE-family HTH domain
MAFMKLNHTRLREEMARTNMRQSDLAKIFGISRQMAYYISHKGGRAYASRLAKLFNCLEESLLFAALGVPPNLRMPEGSSIVNGQIHRKERR